MSICYKYKWQIGIYNFNIYTKNKKLEMPFHNSNLAYNKNLKRITIDLWLNENVEDKEKVISFCKKTAKSYIPEELNIFYKDINQILRKKFIIGKSYK